MTLTLDEALPDRFEARRAFDAARDFESACFIHDEARARLLERLDLVRVEPRVAIDLGCATGRAANALALRYPAAHVLALDSSAGMLRSAARNAAASVSVIGAEAQLWPLRSNCAELVLANLVLPWCHPQPVFAEMARVLTDGGAALFATFGPDSLKEVREAFAAADDRIHVHAAFDMHDLGDLAMAAGLAEPVLDVDRLEVTYSDLDALIRDLRAIGAVNVAGARRRGLTGAQRWRRFERAFPGRADGRLAVTVELILGQAFGPGPRPSRHGGTAEIRVPIEGIKRRSANT